MAGTGSTESTMRTGVNIILLVLIEYVFKDGDGVVSASIDILSVCTPISVYNIQLVCLIFQSNLLITLVHLDCCFAKTLRFQLGHQFI